MSRASATLAGRRFAEQGMVDFCAVTRETATVTNPETGQVTVTTATVYNGKCRVQQAAASASPTDVAQASRYLGELILQLPVTVTTVRPDDLVTVVTASLDPALVGRTFRVRGPGGHKTHDTMRRLQLTEVTG